MRSSTTIIDADTVISSPTSWANGTYEVRANVTVADGGALTVRNATVAFRTAEEGGAGIIVEQGGALAAEGATFSALDQPYSLIVGGRVTLANSTLSGLMSSVPTSYVYFESVGGLMLDGANATLRNVTISGTSSAMVTAFDSTIEAHGLSLSGGELGMLLMGCTANVTDLELEGFYLGLGINGSRAVIDGVRAVGCNSTIWAMDCDLEVRGVRSSAAQDHIGAWNCTLRAGPGRHRRRRWMHVRRHHHGRGAGLLQGLGRRVPRRQLHELFPLPLGPRQRRVHPRVHRGPRDRPRRGRGRGVHLRLRQHVA
jgi:hypothetical protein